MVAASQKTMSGQNNNVHQRRGTGGNQLVHQLAIIFQNKYALLVLNALALLFLVSRNQNEFNDYYDLGVNSLSEMEKNLRSSVSELSIPCPMSTETTTANGGGARGLDTTSTVNIVERNDPELHKTATVMAMATGYDLGTYKRFVGSLRKTGYRGNIILVVAPDIQPQEETYLTEQGVTMHKAQYVTCDHPNKKPPTEEELKKDSHLQELNTCVHPYPKLKSRWARFPLLRDLLENCDGKPDPATACGGPVLITDMRDAFFQRNPFGPEAPRVTGLQVFEEHFGIRTTHWLVDWPVGDCKSVHYDEPMLCSGTTIGTRQAMLDYLQIFHGEMDVWMNDKTCCCFGISGDDQSMHNYLYYSGMLKDVAGGVKAVKNRNGLVHTVGAMGSLIYETHKREKEELRKAQNHPHPENAHNEPFVLSKQEDDSKASNWLGFHYGMTNKDGYFVDYDGSKSFVVHQYDRFGSVFGNWMTRHRHEIYE